MATNSPANTSKPIAVAEGGTGIATATAYGTIVAGTTATGAFQVVSPSTAGQVLTSNGVSSAPSYQAATGGGGLTWNDQTGASVTMTANNGYIANNAGLVTATIPVTAALGAEFAIQGKGAGGWLMQANTGQTIHFGSAVTSTAGSLASTNQYDSLKIVCITADTVFSVTNSVGAAITVA